MGLFCCVVMCGSNSARDNVSFFRIPAELNRNSDKRANTLSRIRREKWLNAIKRADFTEKKIYYGRVCSKHFISGKPASLEDDTNPDWVPSLHMGYNNNSSISAVSKLKRYERRKSYVKRKDQVQDETASQSSAEVIPIDAEPEADSEVVNTKKTQTVLTAEELTNLFLNIALCDERILKLEQVLLCCKNLQNDDTKTRYYTGLPTFKIFSLITKYITPYIKVHGNTILPKQEQVLLTLAKLRLNLHFKDLAYRFGISPTTASSYFKNVIHVMYLRFKKLIIWPERDVLMKTTPACFKESSHGNTTVIIDCFEIRCETPSDLLTAAQAWSNYKHHETIKYLIGITPQGTICFISEGWGGRVSDKFLTENSAFLNNLIPGDVVMADRGFLIKEFVQLFHASVKIPAFTRGKNYLHPVDLEKTRSIAHVRIHVERVISVIRQKFTIVWGPLPITLLSTGGNEPIFDEIIWVCCSLINLCPSVVPL